MNVPPRGVIRKIEGLDVVQVRCSASCWVERIDACYYVFVFVLQARDDAERKLCGVLLALVMVEFFYHAAIFVYDIRKDYVHGLLSFG